MSNTSIFVLTIYIITDLIYAHRKYGKDRINGGKILDILHAVTQ